MRMAHTECVDAYGTHCRLLATYSVLIVTESMRWSLGEGTRLSSPLKSQPCMGKRRRLSLCEGL